jgi:ABC-2 type transport system ATP-binding protein
MAEKIFLEYAIKETKSLSESPIQCSQLSKKFRSLVALDNLDLTVPGGSIYALIGPNGAGKTTLIKTLVNIWRPTSGAASILGIDSRRLSPKEFAQLGYISENQELPEWMTVGYFLNYLKPFYPTWDDARAAEMLKQFDLPIDRKLSQLSRGMKMKAALVSSLAYRPKLIILDEPFSGLDPLVRAEFVEGLMESASDATIFISSHDLAEIESFSSHVGYLDQGRLQFSEESAALLARFREIEVTLLAPAVPANLPASWLRVETAPSVVRFVETRFEDEETEQRIRTFFPTAQRVTIKPMPLREIFIALAKTLRKAA